ncbi:hypothetical protein BGZ54_008521 [Gamsiella multidivaricata]|nr:hypothetical protein BGZ54_008521 [Gamsiella multidivaricata]
MMHTQLKIVLAAMLVALIATMAMAAPAKASTTHHTTTTANPHKKATHTTTALHKSKAVKPKVTTTTHTTSAAHKPKATTTTHTTSAAPKPKATTTTHTTSAAPKPTTPAKMGQTGTILSQTDFCIFLPPKFGGDIALNEDRAVAFCTKPNMPGAANAQVLPAGFIKTAHFVANTTANWVQVTGRIDRSKYGLSPKDGGGQYDMRAPVGNYSGS